MIKGDKGVVTQGHSEVKELDILYNYVKIKEAASLWNVCGESVHTILCQPLYLGVQNEILCVAITNSCNTTNPCFDIYVIMYTLSTCKQTFLRHRIINSFC
jgi:hypothetical protein